MINIDIQKHNTPNKIIKIISENLKSDDILYVNKCVTDDKTEYVEYWKIFTNVNELYEQCSYTFRFGSNGKIKSSKNKVFFDPDVSDLEYSSTNGFDIYPGNEEMVKQIKTKLTQILKK